ncbi:MAG: hypothetical protein ACLSGS_03235 [Adlercreutzia sp.]
MRHPDTGMSQRVHRAACVEFRLTRPSRCPSPQKVQGASTVVVEDEDAEGADRALRPGTPAAGAKAPGGAEGAAPCPEP